MKLTVALALIPFTAAHLCLFSPRQRGTMMDVHKPGAADCNLEKPSPCGGRAPETPVDINNGQMTEIIFQKNLDHYNGLAPGNFTVRIQLPDAKWMELSVVQDSNTTSLHVYKLLVYIPSLLIKEGKNIIQVIYYTNNPQAPPTFYQCADIMVKNSGIGRSPKLRKNYRRDGSMNV